MTIPQIVTIEEVMDHLNLTPVLVGSPPAPGSPATYPGLQLKIDAATEVICNRIAQRKPIDTDWIATIEGWSTGSPAAPPLVKLAVCEQVAEFYRFRGDDEPQNRVQHIGDLADETKSILKAGGYLMETWA